MRACVVVMIALLAAAGCERKSASAEASMAESSEASPALASPPGPTPRAEARAIYASQCAVCHGAYGTGDGPGAGMLDPRPRNYADPAWQAGVTDDELARSIVGGGAAVGKSPQMPAQPQLADRPAVVRELVRLVRTFGK